MEEALKKVTSSTAEPADRIVTLCLRSQKIHLNGMWNWEMNSPAIYCSDVMFFPDEFIGTKGIIHPDDLPKLMGAIGLMEEKELPRLDFRIITTYGEVKAITGQRVSIENNQNEIMEPVPGKEPWEEALQLLTTQIENDFFQLRKDLADYTERLNGIGSWLVAKETGQAWYSDNVFRIYGLAPQSLNAHANTFNHFIHKDDRVTVLDAFERAYEQQTPLHIEYRIALADGESRYIQQVTKWLYTVNGQAVFCGIVRDVTSERAVADELLAVQYHALLHQQLLKFSEQQISSAFWHMNLVTRKTSYSDNYYRIYGLKSTIIPHFNSLLNLVHSDDRRKVSDAIERMYSEHILPEAEFRIIRPDGKMRYLRQSGKLFVSGNKEVVMIGVVQDITVQKGFEKKITELNEYIQLNTAITEMNEMASQTGAITWLADGYMQWSEGFYGMLGYKPGGIEPIPRFLYKHIHPADLKTFKDAEVLVTNQQLHDDIFIRFVSKAGIRQTKISFRQVNYGRDATIALVHDISTQTAFNEELSQHTLFAGLIEDSVTDMVLFTNTDHTIMHWNKAAEERTGILKDAALYHNLFEVLPQLKVENFSSQLHLALKGTEAHNPRATYVYLKKHHDYWLLPMKNEAGEVLGVLHVVHDISRQLELQQQLSERLNFIESLLEASVDRIVVLDRFMNYLYWNKKAEEYYAVNKEKIIGKNILEVFPSFRNHPGYQEFRTVLKGETVFIPAAIVEETNEYFETYLIPIKEEDGSVSAVLWIVHDLSKDYAVAQQQRRTNRILNKIETACYELNSEGKVVYANRRAEEFLGKSNKEMIGKNIWDLFPESKDSRCWLAIQLSALEKKESAQFEYLSAVSNTWISVSATPTEEGCIALFNEVEDIVQARKKLSEEHSKLRETQEQYRSLAENIPDIISRWNRELKLVYANKAFEEKTGIAKTELFGKNNTEIGQPDEIALPWMESLRKVFETAEAVEHFNSFPTPEGEAYFYSRIVPEKNESGEVETVLAIARDITDLSKVQRELKENKDLLNLIFDTSPNSITAYKPVLDVHDNIDDFQIVFVNAFTIKTAGVDPKGLRLTQSFPTAKENGFFEKLKHVMQQKELLDFELWYEGEGMRHWFRMIAVPMEEMVLVTTEDITPRKKAEEEIQKNFAILQHTEELAQTGSWEYEIANGNFHWSKGMYRLFGLPERMMVQPEIYLDHAVEEDRSIAKRIVNSIKKKYQPFDETVKIKKNGEERLLKIKASVTADENGKLQKVIGVDIDITNIQKAEEKLKESRHWLEQTTKASPDSIIIYDLQKKQPAYLNNCLEEWTGVSNKELIEMGIEGRLQLIHPDDRLNLLHANEKTAAAKDGEMITTEYRIQTTEGKTIWLHNRSKPFLRDASGKVTHILSVLQNVTAEVELREQLKQRTQFAEAILDASVDRITVFDRDYKLFGWNKRCEQIHRKTKQEVIGKTIFEIFPGVENYPEFMNSQDLSLKGEFIHVPMVKDDFTGDYLELFYIPLTNEAGETYAVVNIMHDVSDYVVATEQLNALNKKLEIKNTELEQKNDEITSFAFIASHDMKEPLRKIHTFSDWLLQQEMEQLSLKGKSLVEKIGASVHRMEILIDDILVLTKIHSDTNREEDVDLNKIVMQVRDDMTDRISETRTIINVNQMPTVKGNGNQIFYLFKNLISNAIKFQKPGSVPEVIITSEIVSGGEVKISEPGEEYLKLTFTDNGFGFDQRYAKKIFQVFQRLHGKHEFEGTGIGLAICKKIMENHNGIITVESEQGKGSVFSCFFPLH